MKQASAILGIILSFAAAHAFAGPNYGGILIVHANESLSYSTGEMYCGSSDLVDCDIADVRVDGTDPVVCYVLAAFPAEASPRLGGLTLGIDYDDAKLQVEEWGACGDFALPDQGWPGPNEGLAVTWETAQTDHLIEVCWLAVSSNGDPAVLEIIDSPISRAAFGDDDVPANLDDVLGFGALGFNTDGRNPCLTAWDCTLALTPSNIAVYQACGGTFSVGLRVNDVEDLGRFEVCVGYDDTYLNFVNAAVDPIFLGSTGRNVLPGTPLPCDSECEAAGVLISANTTGAPNGPSGSGPLAQISFSPTGAPAASGDVMCLDGGVLSDTDQGPRPIWLDASLGIEVEHRASCYGDFTGDGDVTLFDLGQNIPRWGCSEGDACYDGRYDTNLLERGTYCASTRDGTIDVVDIQSVAGRWHQGCPSEPIQSEDDIASNRMLSSVRISPASLVVTREIGDTLSVALLVEGASNLGGFEAEVSFDPAVIQAYQVQFGDLLSSTGRSPYPLGPQIDNESGVIRLGGITTGETAGAAGTDVVARIVFEVVDCNASSDLGIEHVQLTAVDGWPQEIGDVTGGSVQIDCEVANVPTQTLPSEVQLFASRPNPVSFATEIAFYVPEAVSAHMSVFDAAGRLVRVLLEESVSPGMHQVNWDARDQAGNEVPNGAYFLQLQAGSKALRQQLVVTR